MRNVERVAIGAVVVDVRELTVGDIRELTAGTQGETLDPAIVQRCISRPIEIFTPDEFERIVAAFQRVNAAFYKPGKSSGSNANATNQLDRTCCALIERGHLHVFDYGWGFFLTCIDTAAANGNS